MIRKIVVCLLINAVLLTVSLAEAQQSAKLFKIGWLSADSGRLTEEFVRKALHSLGYVEGKNIFIEFRSSGGRLDRLPALADELAHLKVDLIVASSAGAALAAKNATKTVPIVFASGSDPVAMGLIDSLARPGGNITGFTSIASELAGKRLELLKDTVQKLSRDAVLWDPRGPSSAQEWKESLYPARALGLELHSMEVSSADKYEGAFKQGIKARSTALAVTSSSINNSNHKRIADLAAKHRLPAISHRKEFVASGGLMSYAGADDERFKRLAYLIDRIMKGAQPAELPVERPMGFEFRMNLKTADALKLTIPPIVLMPVTKVI